MAPSNLPPSFERRSSFRCSIAPEDGAARLKINGKVVPCVVINTSSEGFGIRVPKKIGQRLTVKASIQLWFRNEKWQVVKAWEFQDHSQVMTVGLTRVREVTKIKAPSAWGAALIPRFSSDNDASFLIALVVALMLTCICLPGVGDNLGTASKVRQGVNTMVKYVQDTFN